jgi:hypothetical protein
MSALKPPNLWCMTEVPSFGIASTMKARQRLMECLRRSHLQDRIWTCAEVDTAVANLSLLMPELVKHRTHFAKAQDALHEYVASWAGAAVSGAQLMTIATVIAGNLLTFAQGERFVPWNGITPVWASLYVTDVLRDLQRLGHYISTFRTCHGPASGLDIVRPLSRKMARYMIRQVGGVFTEDYLAEDLGGLWLTCILETREGRLAMHEICSSSSQLTYNRGILRRRQGVCQEPAHFGELCYNCEQGRAQCGLARHSAMYLPGICKHSQIAHRGWLTPYDVCLSCLSRGYIEPRPDDNPFN